MTIRTSDRLRLLHWRGGVAPCIHPVTRGTWRHGVIKQNIYKWRDVTLRILLRLWMFSCSLFSVSGKPGHQQNYRPAIDDRHMKHSFASLRPSLVSINVEAYRCVHGPKTMARNVRDRQSRGTGESNQKVRQRWSRSVSSEYDSL